MEGPARAGHDPGGGLRLEWPDFWQPVPDRQGDDRDQLERPSLLRASAGKNRRFGSRKGPPKRRGERRRDNSAWRIARKPAPMKNLTTRRGFAVGRGRRRRSSRANNGPNFKTHRR